MQAGQCGNQIGAKVRDIWLQFQDLSRQIKVVHWIGRGPPLVWHAFYLLSATRYFPN